PGAQLRLAEDERKAGAEHIGALHLVAGAAPAERHFRRYARSPQSPGEDVGASLFFRTERHEEDDGPHEELASGLRDEQRQPFDAGGKPDSRDVTAAQLAHQTVVAAAARHGALRSEPAGCDRLVGSARVVVES